MRYRALAVVFFLLETLQHEWSHSFVYAERDYDRSVAQYTIDLLKQADKVFRLGPNGKDAVVLVGNAGAGTTTIGKILSTNGTDLEAYYSDAHKRFRIRDLSVDSNETCEIASQLPEVMTNPANGLTYYQLPNHRGSQCPNRTELGRVLLFRRLAQHANSVKVLLIADYNSLLGDPEYLGELVQTTFLLFPSGNWTNSIGLVATNVDSNGTDAVIMQRISHSIIIYSDRMCERIRDRVAIAKFGCALSWLLHGGQDGPPKIYFTRVPTRPGRLSDLAEMVEMRTGLSELVLRGLEGATLSPSDLNYTLNATDEEALVCVWMEALVYMKYKLTHQFQSVLNTLYTSAKDNFEQLRPEQIRLASNSRSALKLIADYDGNTDLQLTAIPFWVIAYIFERTMDELEGVIVPLNSSFTHVRQELEDGKNVMRTVYEILETLPADDALARILHPGDETLASWFPPLQHFQSTFCPQFKTSTTEPCSTLSSENTSTSQMALKRRCVLGKVICMVLNEFGFPPSGPAASNSSKHEHLSNTTLDTSDLSKPLPPENGTALGSTLQSIYNFTASHMDSKVETFSRRHNLSQLSPIKRIILYEFITERHLARTYRMLMNGTEAIPFVIMSNFLKSSIKVAQNILVPYGYSSTRLPEQLMEHERAFRLVHEILGTLGNNDGAAEKSTGQDFNNSAFDALANLGSRSCPAFEADITVTVCDAAADDGNNDVVDIEVKQLCRISKVVCTILKQLWQ